MRRKIVRDKNTMSKNYAVIEIETRVVSNVVLADEIGDVGSFPGATVELAPPGTSPGDTITVEGVLEKPPPAPPTLEELTEMISSFCETTILETINGTAQINLAGNSASGRLTSEDAATQVLALDWIQAMQSKCKQLIASKDFNYANADWPIPDPAITELAGRF